MANFSIVLLNPEIPGNTGSIGRTCVALNIPLIIIEPIGFDLSEKAVRRAGLDYWKYVEIKKYSNFEEFLNKESPTSQNLFFMENHKTQTIYQANFQPGAYLIFGSETKGISKEILDIYPNQTYSLPMYSDKIRSLNLSNAATAVAYECLRKTEFIIH
ncbi:tRNA (cytidine(34)-2'-O)-methyltransferase [Bacteriovoracaceae bacterium]|nr:tRNA (cytidine(34)-2'-O)-methyltransferase [Bacteriovoracaceae bacterium]